MANRQYISIIRLFNHCGIGTGDGFVLSRARKQLQAEFSIAQQGFIEVDGYVYTRHDVFEELEQPDVEQRLVFHRQIWDHPELLQLLEENTVNFDTIDKAFVPFWSNKEFDAFFSPYFAVPFQYISRTLLGSNRLAEMGRLLAYEGFLLHAEREEAFRPLRIFMEENERLLRNASSANYDIMRPKIIHWVNGHWYTFFNNLPPEFYDIRNEFIFLFINLSVDLQKKYKKDCIRISEQLVSVVEVPENNRSIIVSNHDAYTGGSSGFSLSLRNGWWMIWIVIMIIRMINCSSNSSSQRFETRKLKSAKLYTPWDTSVKQRPDTSFRLR